jgi:hypothetical protein
LTVLPHLICKGNIFALGIKPEIAACTFPWCPVKSCVLNSSSIRIRRFRRGDWGWSWGWCGNVACVRLVRGDSSTNTVQLWVSTDLDRGKLGLHRLVSVLFRLRQRRCCIQQQRMGSHLQTRTLLSLFSWTALLSILRYGLEFSTD